MFKTINRYKKYKINESGIIINKKNHIIKPAQSERGYLRVALETYDEDGKLAKRTNESVHRLVAETFIPNPNDLPVVMHLDNDKNAIKEKVRIFATESPCVPEKSNTRV